jgi:hypothetical protein
MRRSITAWTGFGWFDKLPPMNATLLLASSTTTIRTRP